MKLFICICFLWLGLNCGANAQQKPPFITDNICESNKEYLTYAAAEGDKLTGMATIDIYVSGKLVTSINFKKGENIDLGFQGECERKGDVRIRLK